MSDGNFNRQLLPHNDLSSGLRAGKAQMRQRALQALHTLLTNHFPQLSDEEIAQLETEFADKLRN